MMKFRFPVALKLVAMALLVLSASAVKAQKLPTATAPGASVTVGGTYSAFQAQYPQRLLGGVGIYADINFRHQIGLEAEVRYLRQNQIADSHQTTYLIGPRIELHRGNFSPFAKALVGNGNLQFPYGFGYGNYLVVGGGAGLDYSLTDNLKIRLVDFEYQYWPDFTLGSIAPRGVSASISYRVYHTGGWRHHRYR